MKKMILPVAALILMLSGMLHAQVAVKKAESPDKNYPFVKGNLLVSKDNIKLNYVKNTEIRHDTLRVKNNWSKPMNLGFDKLPPHLAAVAEPAVLQPDQEGIVVVKYNAALKNDYGYSYENLNIVTNDTAESLKSFFVMVYLEEDFTKLTKDQLENAPRISFKEEKLEFGKIKAGNRIKHSFVFTNEGKSDLIIRKTKASCGCTASEPAKSLLKPGESSTINIDFDTTGMKGDQHKTVFVYNNDPRYSTVALHITGIVE